MYGRGVRPNRNQQGGLLYARLMAAGILHTVDGESTGGTLKTTELGTKKEILVWRDALYMGPVPANVSLKQLSRIRSHFWTRGKKAAEFERRDDMLAKENQYQSVVLWFGAGCVLCQLSLAQVLSWFYERKIPATRLSWVARHGGELAPDQLKQAYSKRSPITAKQMQLAARVWRAFRQPAPVALGRLLTADLTAFPGFQRALVKMLQEYPSKKTGLTRLQTLLMREIERKGNTKTVSVVASVLRRETVGDLLLFDMLQDMVRAQHPLLEFAETFEGKFESWQFNGSVLRLTENGRRILKGKADAVELNGIDRWIGGVHLQGHKIKWRWDEGKRKVARS